MYLNVFVASPKLCGTRADKEKLSGICTQLQRILRDCDCSSDARIALDPDLGQHNIARVTNASPHVRVYVAEKMLCDILRILPDGEMQFDDGSYSLQRIIRLISSLEVID